MRELRFHFNEPGMIEAIAHDPDSDKTPARSTGYGDHTSVPDLMIDRYKKTGQPYAWMCHNFHKSFAAVIWGMKVQMADELFNVPQANLKAVPSTSPSVGHTTTSSSKTANCLLPANRSSGLIRTT